GIGIDYEGLGISLLHGVHARTLRVLTPADLSASAPDFVRVEGLELDAPLWAVALGERNVDALRIHSIELAVVQDESGRNSVSELFPPAPKPKPEENTPLSQTLAKLPSVSLRTLDIDAMKARLVELRSGAAPRVTTFGTLGLLGNLKTGPEGLLGTELRLGPAPSLRLEQTGEHGARRADLALDVHVSAPDAQTVSLSSELGVHEQDWAPITLPGGPLFALAARAQFDAKGQQTRIALSNLSAWDGALSASLDANVFDAPSLHVLANGKAAAHLAALPVAVEGLAFSALDFELGARDLAWDPESVKGALDWRGSLRGLHFEQAQGSAEAESITLQGQGDVAAQGGTLRARAEAAGLSWKAPDLSAALGPLKLELNGTLGAANGTQDVAVESHLTLDEANVKRADGQTVALANASLKSHLKGTVAGLRSRAIPELVSNLTLERLAATAGRQTTTLEKLSIDSSLARVAPDPASPFGMNGAANLVLQLPNLAISEGSARGARKSVLSATGFELHASGPLSLARVTGTLGL
ncbi:MAG TPA: hypothetical protein VG963_19020, partial [Polyangiaceae bacterium]|nr:hypothetical protein [Polyangiaceae bacterium]